MTATTWRKVFAQAVGADLYEPDHRWRMRAVLAALARGGAPVADSKPSPA